MPGNGTRYSRADSRAEVSIFIHIKRKPDIQLVGQHIYFNLNSLQTKNFRAQKISTGNTNYKVLKNQKGSSFNIWIKDRVFKLTFTICLVNGP